MGEEIDFQSATDEELSGISATLEQTKSDLQGIQNAIGDSGVTESERAQVDQALSETENTFSNIDESSDDVPEPSQDQDMTQSAVISTDDARRKVEEGQNFLDQTENNIANANNQRLNFTDSEAQLNQQRMEGQLDAVDQQFQSVNTMLDSYSETLDESYQNQVKSLQNLYDSRRESQRQVNEQYMAGTQTSNIVSGRSRYAPQMSNTLLNQAEQRGLEKLSEIDRKERKATREARKANLNQQYEIMNQRIESAQNAQEQKTQMLQDMRDYALRRNNQLLQLKRFQMNQAQTRQEMQKARAKATVPALYTELQNVEGTQERAQRIEQFASSSGVDSNYLMGQLQRYSNDQQQYELEMEQTRQSVRDSRVANEISRQKLALTRQETQSSIATDQAQAAKYRAQATDTLSGNGNEISGVTDEYLKALKNERDKLRQKEINDSEIYSILRNDIPVETEGAKKDVLASIGLNEPEAAQEFEQESIPSGLLSKVLSTEELIRANEKFNQKNYNYGFWDVTGPSAPSDDELAKNLGPFIESQRRAGISNDQIFENLKGS